jgi:hypothetical protein
LIVTKTREVNETASAMIVLTLMTWHLPAFLTHPPPVQTAGESILARKEFSSRIILNALRDKVLAILARLRFRVDGRELGRAA